MKRVEPIDLDWVFHDDKACLDEEDVQRLREHLIRLQH